VTDDPNDLDGFLEQLAGEGGTPDLIDHPGSEVLSAYSAHALPPEEELRVQEHLAVCRRCRDLLLDFASFLETPLAERTEGVTDLAGAAEWRALRERMRRESGGSEEPRTREPARDYRLVRTLRVFQTLAAVLGILVVGLSVYAVRPHGQPGILPPPQEPLSFTTTRSAGQVETPLEIYLPCGLRFYTPSQYRKYRVEILDSDNRSRYSAETTLSEGIIPLEKDTLPPGTYDVVMSGLNGGRAEPIGISKKLIVKP
jgi:hypothetical protein